MKTGWIKELKRRHVFRAAVVYLVVAWVVLQVADVVVPALGLPEWVVALVLTLLALGLPLALVLAWAYELTPEGLRRTDSSAEVAAAGAAAAGPTAVAEIYEFGEFRLDVSRRELSRDGEAVELQPRVFDLLVYLVRRRDTAVSKQQLQDDIWSGTVVTEASLTRAVMKLRQAVGDDASSQSVIKTLHGHGYRFVAPLTDSTASAAGGEAATTAGQTAPAGRGLRWWLPIALLAAVLGVVAVSLRSLWPPDVHGTKVAVLPVADRTGEADLAWVRLGLMSLVNELVATADGLDVVPDNEVVRLTDGTTSEAPEILVERLRHAYGATHVVSMDLERTGGMLRMTYRLLDADGREVAGTMVDDDPTALARGAARSVVSEIGGQMRMRSPSELVSDDPFVNEAFARGSALSLEGRCADARPLFQIVIDAEPTLFEPRYRYASCSRILGEPELAESMLIELVAEQRANPPGRPLARALLTLGVVYNRTGRLDEAEAAETEALEIAQSLEDHDLAGRILINLSIVAEDRGDLDEARDWLGRALLAYERDGRDVLPGQVYSALSNLAMDEGDLEEADRYVLMALESFRYVGDRRDEAMMLNNRGLVKRNQGLLDEAEALHEASYELRRELGDRVGMSRVKNLMAGLYLDRGQFEAAIEAGQEAAVIAEETRDRLFHAVALSHLGSAEQGRGRFDAAQAYFDESRAIFVEIQDRMRTLMTDIRLARLALDRGEDVEARAEALLAQAREDGYDVPEVEAMELLGDIAESAGRTGEAADRYREAMALLGELGWEAKETEIAAKLAEAYLRLDQLAAAEPLVGLVSARPQTLASYRLRARYAMARGDAATAAELMAAARELGDERWGEDDEALLATGGQ